jgi:RNA polymerase sigma-70 factor (ECF subfamily)
MTHSAPPPSLRTASDDALPISSIVSPENERMVRSYVAVLAGDPDAVGDLSQEVFLRAIERLDLLASSPDPARTLRGIARRVALEFLRRRRRSRRYVDVTLGTLAGEDARVAEAVQHAESIHRLRLAMEDLPILSRRMLEMRYHDGLNASEIGERLGIQPGAVRITLLRIRERLRIRIESPALAAA